MKPNIRWVPLIDGTVRAWSVMGIEQPSSTPLHGTALDSLAQEGRTWVSLSSSFLRRISLLRHRFILRHRCCLNSFGSTSNLIAILTLQTWFTFMEETPDYWVQSKPRVKSKVHLSTNIMLTDPKSCEGLSRHRLYPSVPFRKPAFVQVRWSGTLIRKEEHLCPYWK